MCVTLHLACTRREKAPLPPNDQLVIFAASSLRDAFNDLSTEFKQSHQNLEITLNFAGSQELRMQVEHGASFDVFASADMLQMDALAKTAFVDNPAIFARNEPVIVVSKAHASSVHGIDDLPFADRLILGASDVPIGRYTSKILDNVSRKQSVDFRGRVEARVVSRELNVRQVMAKVVLGEVDAAIVYRTDTVHAVDNVLMYAIPSDVNVIAEYPIATATHAPHVQLARDWVTFVLSMKGRSTLKRHGFRTDAITLRAEPP